MEPNSPFEWFALHTKPGAENIAARTVSTLGLETFLPMASISGVATAFVSVGITRFSVLMFLCFVAEGAGVLSSPRSPIECYVSDDSGQHSDASPESLVPFVVVMKTETKTQNRT